MLPLIAVLSAAWIDVDPVTCTIRGKSIEITLTGTKWKKKSRPLPGMHRAHIQVSVPANEQSFQANQSSLHYCFYLFNDLQAFANGLHWRSWLWAQRWQSKNDATYLKWVVWAVIHTTCFHFKPIDNQLVLKQQSGQTEEITCITFLTEPGIIIRYQVTGT